MISKEMIKNNYIKGYISIEDSTDGCVGLCCKIGDYSFYFVRDDSSVEEYLKSHSVDEIVNIIYEILRDKETAETNGIYELEYGYYVAFLKED